MKKKATHHSNQPGVSHAVSEFDNPKNRPDMGKGPAKDATRRSKVEAPTSEAAEPPKTFGRKATRRARFDSLTKKARRAQ